MRGIVKMPYLVREKSARRTDTARVMLHDARAGHSL